VRSARNASEFVELVRSSDPATLAGKEAAAMAQFAEQNTWATRLVEIDRIVAELSFTVGYPGSSTDPTPSLGQCQLLQSPRDSAEIDRSVFPVAPGKMLK
jgi:hypothetical protein